MKNKKSYVYIGLPVLGMIFYLAYIRRSAIDMVYSDYIRLINSYLPDVWNPDDGFRWANPSRMAFSSMLDSHRREKGFLHPACWYTKRKISSPSRPASVG